MTPGYGRSQVTGLARMNGHPVGVIANDCHRDGGAMTAEGAQKIRRFVETCDSFHLPIVSCVDEPGFMIGQAAERAGTIRYPARPNNTTKRSRLTTSSIGPIVKG